jgi:hypothetical protein
MELGLEDASAAYVDIIVVGSTIGTIGTSLPFTYHERFRFHRVYQFIGVAPYTIGPISSDYNDMPDVTKYRISVNYDAFEPDSAKVTFIALPGAPVAPALDIVFDTTATIHVTKKFA